MTLLKHAFRQLVLRPALSGTVIAMLALGVGAATAIFSLFYQVLVQPLPVPEPERLVNIVHLGSAPDAPRESFSYPMFRDLEGAQGGAFRIAGHIPFGANVAYEGGAFNVPGVFVSGAYFDVLGLRPALGRLIGPQDEPRVGESAVAVLSYDLWRGRFGGDPGIVGRELTIAGQPLTVVGVAPAGFSGTQLGERTQVFVPITMRWRLTPSAVDTPDGRNFSSVFLFARLGTNGSAAEAAARLNTLYAGILRDVEAPLRSLPQDQLQRFLLDRIELRPGARGQGTIAGASRSLTLLLGVTLLVLVIVCVNVANLLLVRGASRAGEIAVRESIGATRGRLVAELLAETALPAAIGGALALLVARSTLSAVAPILPPRLAEGLGMQIGPTAVAFAALATLLAAAAFGVFPALRTARSVKGEIPPQLFMPFPPAGNDDAFLGFLSGARTFYVRSAVDPAAMLRAIPRAVAAVDPTLPVQNLVTMRRQAEESIFVDRLVTTLSASFAALATLLAAIGLYGVMAYNVAARTRELGLRLALGAEPRRLRTMVLKQVAAMTAIGVSLGLAGAIGSGRAAEALLFGLSGHDPKVLAAAAAVLAAVVLTASYWPARRAARIAPMEALRHE